MSEQPLLIQPKRDFLASAGPWAETFSKGVAGIAVALYACGFLIVSLHHSKFGFVGTNPFRPRVLAAGAWFFFFTGIPVSIAVGFRSDSWQKIGRNAAGVWIACLSLGFALNFLFDYTPLLALSPLHLPLWLLVTLTAAWVLLVALTASDRPKIPKWVATGGSILLAVLYVADPARRLFIKNEFSTSSLGLWFFAVFLVALLEFKIRRVEQLTSFGGWSKPMSVLFGALLVFSQYVYPRLKASWGGGTPSNVTIYFTKDSLLSPNKFVQAQLIEEADEGFYIVGPKESKAIFVPRNAVALIYFSDKAADSPLLQGNK